MSLHVEVRGPHKSGKTRAANIIKEALHTAGIKAVLSESVPHKPQADDAGLVGKKRPPLVLTPEQAAEEREILKKINEYQIIQSVLYDLNLLPEQLFSFADLEHRDYRDANWFHMISITIHFLALLEPQEKPPLDPNSPVIEINRSKNIVKLPGYEFSIDLTNGYRLSIKD